ncbi:hypothetical protein Aperf_G00000090140 [Anoplocephala perfoliata]
MIICLGFTLYKELDRPFSVQLLLFDATSATWQLAAYQLNTLCGLWKAPDAGDPFNLLWHSPRISMFNEERTLNPKAVELLIHAMLLPPTQARSELKNTRIGRLIPDSVGEDVEAGTLGGIPEGSSGVELTAAEREALRASEGDEIARLNVPNRVFTHRLPHPNEVFFLKMTKKEDLIAEMQEKMPVFGGPKNPDCEGGSEIPESSREILRRHRLDCRNRTSKNRVQKRPPRWR